MIPVIDVAPLRSGSPPEDAGGRVAAGIREACCDSGFFYVVGHGVDEGLIARVDALHRDFFALPEARKQAIAMARGGRAWRGWFPVGGELTLGRPDQKQGVYYGAELPADDPRVRAGLPLHGPNLFPDEIPELRGAVLAYLEALTALGHDLVRGIALSLGLAAAYFEERYTADPLILFRAFLYPPLSGEDAELFSVGEHTDYGLLTILRQDDAGGLEVKCGGRWLAAPPVPGSFVCNIGDMLDRMTGGLYRSTAHRVRNTSGRERLSLPFFFDPGFDARVAPVATPALPGDDAAERWDGRSPHAFDGTYGEYLVDKVSRVFPELGRAALG